MKKIRKIGLLIASGVLAIMGLSGCASKFMPLLYGVPNPNVPEEEWDAPNTKLEKKVEDLKVVEHP